MIDETNISPTTSTCSGVKTSTDKKPTTSTAIPASPPAEQRGDVMDNLEPQASDEFRVLDDGSDEVEIVSELRQDSESSDEWDDDDDSQTSSQEQEQEDEIIGDTEFGDDVDDNQSTDEWGQEPKISFEKVMDFIAFPEKHLFQQSSAEKEEGVEVDNEMGVVNSDSEYGEEPEQEKEQEKEDEDVLPTTETKPTSTSPLTVNTSSSETDVSKNGEASVPPTTSSPKEEEAEDAKQKTGDIEGSESVEVVLPANHKLQKDKTTTTPSASPTSSNSPRQWFSNWFQPIVGAEQRIVATVSKESKEEPLGVFIKKVLLKDGLYISQLQQDSEIASLGLLKPGMKILTINGKPCPQTVKDFRELVSSLEGKVTIVAQPPETENEGLVVVTIFKETKTQPLGLILKRQMFREGLVVAKVLDGSIFCDTELKEGMRIIRVNDQQCPASVDAFRDLLQEIDGQVKIVAEPTTVSQSSSNSSQAKEAEKDEEETADDKKEEDNEESSKEKSEDSSVTPTKEEDTPAEEVVPSLPKIFKHNGVDRKEVVCKIVKNGTHEPLGLLLREFKDEEGIHVLQLDETSSKLGATALRPGMTIHKINGQDCPYKVDECIKLLRSIKGSLTIVASELYED